MTSSKVIITNQKSTFNQYAPEDEVGLSTYDLSLISLNKIIKKRKLYANKMSGITYLI